MKLTKSSSKALHHANILKACSVSMMMMKQNNQCSTRCIHDHSDFKRGLIITTQSGVDVMNNSLLNKGTSFTRTERDRLHIRGLLPAVIVDIDTQLLRIRERYNMLASDIERYQFLTQLQDRNETLFYKFLVNNIKELAPIIYTPTVGKACESFSHIFRKPRGMFFSAEDRGEMKAMVYNYPVDEIDVIVVTDGGRILGLGDLGANGDGIPIGKLSLYVAAGGINPGRVMPVMLDVGTNNEKLLNDPLYLGIRRKRLTGQEYFDVLDEFMEAVTTRWPKVLIQFEDFTSDKAEIVLKKYRNRCLSFNDDIQGTGSVIVAGILNSLRAIGQQFSDIKHQKFLVVGSGGAGLGVANALKEAMVREGLDDEEARKNFYVVDKDGLLTQRRIEEGDEKGIAFTASQRSYAEVRDDLPEGLSILETIKTVKPDILLGLSGVGGLFTEDILREMNRQCAERGKEPIIFPLSNPTSKSEASAELVFRCTEGRGVFASGSPFDDVTLPNGLTIRPPQANNMFIFPGVGLGSILAGSKHISNNMFYAASKSLAASVSDEAIKRKEVYPRVEDIREVTKKVAVGVIRQAVSEGNALKFADKSKTFIDSNAEMEEYVGKRMWCPQYVPIVN
ncbi:hypothetical protein C9374_005119 [Naegleria lovaniensis]|uniref:Malic enzyme n=1 Tax=Naegleria lovaniensis TaxID=51637 RepID=A0AA88GNX7_NAELO|nr:uncharacterized protein C9374_005119 [Naegleria lovaniensis]KAG2382539.1 hypothetical protein C9374_005119 [Naegleria lovaniensis]